MNKWNQALKRVAAFLMAAAMVITTVDLTAFKVSAEESVRVDMPIEIIELPTIETTAQSISLFTLDGSGQVALKEGSHVKWIDRLDLTGADYAKNFYDWLVTNSRPETAVTSPTSAALFDPVGNTTGEVLYLDTDGDSVGDAYAYPVEEFTGTATITYTGNRDTDGAAARAAIANELTANQEAGFTYISAVYSAFDRDCPEVFWLDGASSMLNSYSYGYDSAGNVDYTQNIYFLLKSDKFDIRDTGYQDADTLKTAIEGTFVQDGNACETILAGLEAEADTYEKVKYFNSWLTRNNCYNSDLNNADSDAWECISALTGLTGTEGPVCEGYARAFKVLCDKESIPCVLVDGTANNGSGSEGHMWNYVRMDDSKWYAVDVTWNDPTTGTSNAVSGSENENYFLVGSDTEIGEMTFIESHPVSNTVVENGVAFTNGPSIENGKYVYVEQGTDEEALSTDMISLSASSVTYNGAEQKPTVTVTDSEKTLTLTEGVDYTVAFSTDMTNAGEKTITVTGMGNYTGSEEVTFTIARATITVTADDQTVVVDGVPDSRKVTVGGEYGLAEGHDISVTYEDVDTSVVGTKILTIDTVTITDAEGNDVTSNYSVTEKNAGTLTVKTHEHDWDYIVEGTAIKATCVSTLGTCEDPEQSITLVAPVANLTYDGNEKVATIEGTIDGIEDPEIKYAGSGLVNGKPVNAGEYTASIEIGDAMAEVAFTVLARSIAGAAITGVQDQTYTGETFRPSPIVVVDGRMLVEDTDYTVSYSNAVNAGTATITVTGKGNYSGMVTKTFVIAQADTPAIIWPTASDLTYGQTLDESVLNGGSTEYGTFAWEDGTQIPTAGEKACVVVFTPSALTVQNYKNMSETKQTVTVIVKKAVPEYTVPSDLSGQYGQTLTQVALPEGWSWDVPETSVGNAGTHEFAATYTPKDTANYEIVQKNLGVKVEPIALTITEVTAENRFYDGTDVVKIVGVTLSGVLTGDEVFVNLAGLTGKVSSREIGTYTSVILPEMTLNGAAAANYVLIQPTEAVPTQVEIFKATASITLKTDIYRKIYGDEPFSIAEDIAVVGDGKLVYSVSGAMDRYGQSTDGDDVVTVSENGQVTILGSGSVTVTLTMAETAGYYEAEPKTISIQVTAWDDIPQDGFFIRTMDAETYTGKAIKPEPEVWDGNGEFRLEKGRDYTISYKNNTKAYTLKEGEKDFNPKKAPTMIIKGKGNYDQKLTVYFTIQPKDITDVTDTSIVAEDMVVEANGRTQEKVPVVKFHNKKLGKADFVCDYPAEGADAYKELGTYPIVITGKGNFTGSRNVNLIVAAKGNNLAKATIKKIPAQEFDGVHAVELDETELVVTAKVNGKKEILKKGVHYTVEYANHTGIGTATVTVKAATGSGFAGFKKATFKITGVSIAKANVEGVENRVYNGSAQKLALKVTASVKDAATGATKEVVLVEGTDYTATYSKNTNVGTATVTIKGIGKYTGSIKKTFKITAANVADIVTVKDGELTAKYVKGGAKPSVSLVFNGMALKEGKDYTVTYKNSKAVYTARAGESGYDAKKAPTITIKGKGNFAGSVSRTFTITGRSLTDADMVVTMTVADKAVSTKKGGYISKVVVADADGKVLKQGVDYSAPVYTMVNEKGETVTLTKDDTASVGSVITVSITGMGAYEDAEGKALTATYRITANDFTKVKVQIIQKKYTGKTVELTAADFVNEDGSSKVTFGSGGNATQLVYGKDFEVVPGSYKNNLKKGTATVTIKGCGEYGGTKTVKFKIGARSLWFWWL